MTGTLVVIVVIAIIAFSVWRKQTADAKAGMQLLPSSSQVAYGGSIDGELKVQGRSDFLAERVQVYLVAKAADGKLGGKSTRHIEVYRQPALLADNLNITSGSDFAWPFSLDMPGLSLDAADETGLAKQVKKRNPIQWRLEAVLHTEGVDVSTDIPLEVSNKAMLQVD